MSKGANITFKIDTAALASFATGMSSAAEAMRKLSDSVVKAMTGLQFRAIRREDGRIDFESLPVGDPQEMDRTKSALERAQELRGPGRALRVFEGERPEPKARPALGVHAARKLTPKQVNLIRMKYRDRFGSEESLLKELANKTGDECFQCLEDAPFAYMNLLIKLCGGPWEPGGWKK